MARALSAVFDPAGSVTPAVGRSNGSVTRSLHPALTNSLQIRLWFNVLVSPLTVCESHTELRCVLDLEIIPKADSVGELLLVEDVAERLQR